ncbi:MAG: pilus assembly protein TadG-related protein [Acidimicrobiales bacterium]
MGERGSTLVLVPVAVLIVMVLGAIAVDSAQVYLGQRQLSDAAAAAAHDAAGAISSSAFYGTGTVMLDPARATAVADQATAAEHLGTGVQLAAPVTVAVSGDQVCVSLTGVVLPVFGRALPGIGRGQSVTAFAVASDVGGRVTVTRSPRAC